jgi:hypothetical protein
MLDHYQVQLTRMLEAEQYGEAKELLRFLLQCQGEDARHYEEWDSLLTWLDMAFPEDGNGEDGTGFILAKQEKEDDEATMREQLLNPPDQDEAYVNQVLYIMQNHPMIDQQILALERAVYIQSPDLNDSIKKWLVTSQVHPVVQFKALQCLQARRHRTASPGEIGGDRRAHTGSYASFNG